MKKILFITTLLLITVTYSQKNLELNQVLNVELTSEGVTIPDGKAWKIEGTWGYYYDATSGYAFLTVNDETFPLRDSNIYPLWFPAGTVFKKTAGSSGYDVKFLSVLEFNLVPITSSGGDTGGIDSTGSSSSSIGNSFANNAGIPGEDFTDLDGNTYGTTNINGMIWTTSNYQGSTYSDGTPIPYISDFNEWKNATTGGYTYWVQDASLGYGKLYNLHALRGRHDDDDSTPNKKFAPDGWHLPDYSEISYIHSLYNNDPTINAYYLKSLTSWFADANGNNVSGLDIKAYPALTYFSNENWGFTSASGFNSGDYTYQNVGGSTSFGTSTPMGSSTGDILRVNYKYYIDLSTASMGTGLYSFTPFLDGIAGNNNYNNEGIYVRLIKDY